MTCAIINTFPDGSETVCGKKASRYITPDYDSGICDDCARSMVLHGDFSQEEVNVEYPKIEGQS